MSFDTGVEVTQSTVTVIAILSVRLSVTLRHCAQTAKSISDEPFVL